MELKDKVIVVTGASGGIGLEIARALVAAQAQVVLAARSQDKLAQAASSLSEAGGSVLPVVMDVTDTATVDAAIAQVLQRFGRIDVVVNNAGNGGALGYWSGSDVEATRAMFDVHVFGAERVIRAVLPAMQQQGSGTIVNFASTVAWVPMPGGAAYSAAKAALVSLSETLRAELQPLNIDVRVFAPPHTNTEAGRAWPLQLPKIFEPEWVAAEFVRALRGKQQRVLAGGNEALLLIQRLSPRIAAHIMNGVGFKALGRVEQDASAASRGRPGARNAGEVCEPATSSVRSV